jgi:2-polyprenyl-3-methyl-5-hydroxy-6-metoxy-1,4-benzoquinol methylase
MSLSSSAESPASNGATNTSRPVSDEEYCHERLGPRFERALSSYDTQERVKLLIDEFLSDGMIQNKRILDVGCGLGYFSERLAQRGAQVVACDLGPSLVEATRSRAACPGEVADVLQLSKHFDERSFDGVVSSECIEHTPDPALAIREMVKVVKPRGFLSISTPNIVWSPVVRTATRLRLRPFDGHENFSSWRGIRHALRIAGAEPIHEQGLHLFPFQLPLHGISRWCDQHLQHFRMLMINLCILAQKS